MNHLDITLQELYNIFKSENKIIDIYGSVLDIGKGDTNVFKDFFQKELGLAYVGVDSDVHIRNAVNTIICDMHNIPFQNHTFTLIFSSHSFEHSNNPIKLLKEMNRLLMIGGIILISTPYYCHESYKTYPEHLFVLTETQLERLLTYTGFQILKIYIAKGNEEESKKWNVITIGMKMTECDKRLKIFKD